MSNSSSWLRKISASGSRWVFEAKFRFWYIKKPISHLDRYSREKGGLGWKNENPCFENISGVSGSWFHLRGGEQSQGFSEVKHSKSQNGFFTMSSLELKLSETISIFPIRWVETKIFEFEDFGLEVERSQLVGPKISKWVYSHHFLLPHRTHRNWRNWIWIIVTHFMNFRRSTNYQLEGRWRVTKR